MVIENNAAQSELYIQVVASRSAEMQLHLACPISLRLSPRVSERRRSGSPQQCMEVLEEL